MDELRQGFEALIAQGDFAQGLHQLQRPSPAPAEDTEQRLNWAFAHPQLREARGVLELERIALQTALKGRISQEKRAQIMYNLGCIALHQKRTQDARLCFGQAIRSRPLHAPSHCNLGYAYECAGRLEKARQCYQAATEIAVDAVLPRINLALLLQQQGQREEALQALQAIYRSKPRHHGVALHLCRLLAQHGGAEDLEQVLQITREHPFPHSGVQLQECRALALYRLDDLPAAREAFDQVLEAQPDNRFARLGLAHIRHLISLRDTRNFQGRHEVDSLLEQAFIQHEHSHPHPADPLLDTEEHPTGPFAWLTKLRRFFF